MKIFDGNTGKQTMTERHLLKLIAPEPTNAHMDVIVRFDEETSTYTTEYYLENESLVGVWISKVKDGGIKREYYPAG